MGNPTLEVDITAVDETGQAVKSARQNLGTIGDTVKGVHKNLQDAVKGKSSFAELNKNLNASIKASGAKSLLGGLDKMKGGSILDLGKGLAEAAEGAEALAGSMGILALGMGGVTAAAGAAAVAAYKFTKPWINGAANIGQLSMALGIATRDLQTFEGAAARVGVSKDNADSALGGLAGAAHAALYSPGGGEQRAMFGALGIDYHKYADKNGKVDLPNLMAAVADGISRQGNAQSAAHAAQSLGVSSALPALRQGSGWLRSNMRSVASFGYYSDTDVQRAMQGAQDDVINGQFVGRMARRARGAVAKHGVLQGMDGLAALASAGVGAPQSKAPSLLGGPGGGQRASLLAGPRLQDLAPSDLTRPTLAGALSSQLPSVAFGNVVQTKFAPAADKLARTADSLVAFFQHQGWSKPQAAGIVGNLYAENPTFDPGRWQMLRGGRRGQGYGIGQWEGPRRKDFEALHGRDMVGSSLLDQAGWVNYELTRGSRRGAGNKLRDASSVEDASAIVTRLYEQPADKHHTAVGLRQGYAEQALSGTLHVTVSVEDKRVRARVRHDHPGGASIHYDATGTG